MIRRPPRSTLDRSSAASDVYKRQELGISERVVFVGRQPPAVVARWMQAADAVCLSSLNEGVPNVVLELSLIHISEPTRPY